MDERKKLILYMAAILSVAGFSFHIITSYFFVTLILSPFLVFLLISVASFLPVFLAQSYINNKDKIAFCISAILIALVLLFLPALSSTKNALGDGVASEIANLLGVCAVSFVFFYIMSRFISRIPTIFFLLFFVVECSILIFFGLPFLFM